MEKKIIEAHKGNRGRMTEEEIIEDREYVFNREIDSIYKLFTDYKSSRFRALFGLYYPIGLTREFGTANQAYTFMYYYNELIIPNYLFFSGKGNKIQFKIGKHRFEDVADEDPNYEDWSIEAHLMYSYNIAIILRSGENINFHHTFLPEKFYEQELWNRKWRMTLSYVKIFDLLQHLDKGTATVAYIETIEKEIQDALLLKLPQDEDRINAIHVHLPLCNIYKQILRQDQDQYEEAVYEALLQWKIRYTMTYKDREKYDEDATWDPRGFWAFPIIAACAYAYDHGMSVPNIETGYLSDWMIRGDFSQVKLLVE